MEQRSPYGDGGDAARIETVTRTCKALGDASRLQLLALLAHGERPAGALARGVGLTPATVSHHLARLAEAGLVTQRKAGTARYYALEESHLATLAAESLTPAGLRALMPLPLAESLSSKPALPLSDPQFFVSP
ncbi:MAG: ArsR/SmtB family transcription factor [Candidatus Hydrogenedentota bacterium]